MSTLIVLGGFFAIELGLTTAIGELIAGMFVNQFLGGVANFELIDTLADIGILVLMYVAGLEIDLDQLQKRFRPSFLIGFFAFVVPFFSIITISHFILMESITVSVLAAIALSTTSVAIIYPMLLEGCGFNESKNLMLSAAMITDILSMAALGVFTPNPALTILLIVLLFVFAKVFPFLGGRIFKYYKGNVAEFEFKMILLLLLAVAVVSEKAGFESAITAFLLGMITSGIVVQHEDLALKLKGIVFGFFAPIFFFSVGLRISFISLVDHMGLLLLLFFVGFTMKYIATYLVSRHFLPDSASYMGALFNSNMTIGVMVAVFGFESGMLDMSFYSAIIGAVLLSSILSIVLCRKKC